MLRKRKGFTKERDLLNFLFLYRFSVTARSVVFAKEKPSNNLKHKTSSHFKFTLRSKREVYFSFSPLWSEQYQISFCETFLNADRKKCIFNDRDDFATIFIRFFNAFLRMSLVLKNIQR